MAAVCDWARGVKERPTPSRAATFESPQILRLVLTSIDGQRGIVDRDLEFVVADDESQDEAEAPR